MPPSDRIDALMESALGRGVFPGAALLCALEGEVVLERVYGLAQRVGGHRPVLPGTRFDLASLTKALGTSVAAMLAYEKGKLELDRPIGEQLSVDAGLGRVTPWHLLSHSAGVPAWLPLHEQAEAAGMLSEPPERAREWIRQRVAEVGQEYEPGSRSVYSDLGFMLLEWLLEQVTGDRIDGLLQRCCFDPLGLHTTGYRERAAPPGRESFAATEHCPWRKRVLVGEVHDHNSWAMGGVSGQAGLFSTARDVHRLLQELWTCWQGGRGLLAPETVRLFWSPSGVPDSCFRLGWDGPSLTGYSSAGRRISRAAVGHLGFTGCSLWLDPDPGFWVVLLTNRIHPSAQDRRIAELRPVLHDVLVRELRE